jgi:hypothetical protein
MGPHMPHAHLGWRKAGSLGNQHMCTQKCSAHPSMGTQHGQVVLHFLVPQGEVALRAVLLSLRTLEHEVVRQLVGEDGSPAEVGALSSHHRTHLGCGRESKQENGQEVRELGWGTAACVTMRGGRCGQTTSEQSEW